jgi:heterodisulfide reductase subunit A-like polyferredoxin
MAENDEHVNFLTPGIPRIAKRLAVRYARVPGIHIMVRRDRCIGCGACVKKGFCRFGAISITERTVSIDERRCRGCSRCTHLCPRDALAIEVRPPAMVRSALKHIDNKIDELLK